MKRKLTKSQLSMLKKQRLFEQRIAKSREKKILECYIYLSSEIEREFIKSDIKDLKDFIDKTIDTGFKTQLKLKLNAIAKMNIDDFVKYFIEVFKRNINIDEVQIIKSKLLNKFLDKYVGETVKNVSNTTKDILKNRISKYTQEGLNFRDLTKRLVEDTRGEIGIKRARIIARTETSKAITASNHITAVKAGFKKKTWVYTHGSVTKREYHLVMNGVTIDIDKKFDVGGEGKVPPVKMRFPKDPECRVPGQVISCACMIFYK